MMGYIGWLVGWDIIYRMVGRLGYNISGGWYSVIYKVVGRLGFIGWLVGWDKQGGW